MKRKYLEYMRFAIILGITALMFVPIFFFQNCGEGFEANSHEVSSFLRSVVDDGDNGGDKNSDNKVFFKVEADRVTYGGVEVDDADPLTFNVLKGHFAEDKSFYYMGTEKVPKSNYLIFDVINDYFVNINQRVYSFDGHSLLDIGKQDMIALQGPKFQFGGKTYFLSSALPSNRDTATYTFVNESNYLTNKLTRDANKVYFNNQELMVNNLANFEYIDRSLFKVGDKVVNHVVRVQGADAATITPINEKYIKDKNSVYYYSYKMNDVNPDQFVVLNHNYVRDDKFIYYRDKKVTEYIEGQRLEFINDFLIFGNKVYANDRFVSDVGEGAILPVGKNFLKQGDKIICSNGDNISIAGKKVKIFKEIFVVDDKLYSNCNRYYAVKHDDVKENSHGYIYDYENVYGQYIKVATSQGAQFRKLFFSYYTDGNKVYNGNNDTGLTYNASLDFVSRFVLKQGLNIVQNDSKVTLQSSNVVFFSSNDWYEEGKLFHNGRVVSENVDITSLELLPFLNYGRLKDRNNVFAFGKKVEGADPSSYELLTHSYAKDKSYVYYRDKKLQGADASSFQVMHEDTTHILLKAHSPYGKDSNSIYYRGEVIEGVDVNGYRFLENGLLLSNGRAYFNGKYLENLDTESFAYNKELSIYFDKERVYSPLGELIANAKPDDLKKINHNYFTSNGRVFFSYKEIVGADPGSFHISTYSSNISYDKNYIYLNAEQKTKIEGGELTEASFGYFINSEKVYHQYNEIVGVSPEGFANTNDELYFISNGKVYRKRFRDATEVKGVDAQTFESLRPYGFSFSYTKDKNNIFFGFTKMEGVDIKSFNYFDSRSYYTYDKNSVYYASRKIETADVATFKVLIVEGSNSYYAIDKNAVYFQGRAIEQADLASFQTFPRDIATSYYARDKNKVYFNGQASEVESPETFRLIFIENINTGYSVDSNNAYYYGDKLSSVDLETFEPLKGGDNLYYYARDKNKVFAQKAVIAGADPSSFSVFPHKEAGVSGVFYSRDKSSVFFANQKILDADVETFTLKTYNTAEDKNYLYRGRVRTAK